MKFDFFTLGGSQMWEDVFFYQKWRIQRNYKTKKYRLLDNWDIRRAEGTFSNCRRAFLKYIEVFQLARQRGHMVIMLHGLGESKNIFKPLWRQVTKEGFMAAAVNYPSTRKRLDGHIRQLDFFMNHLEDVQDVSFVTHGIGAVVLKRLLSFDSPWQHRLKIHRIIEVCPPATGNNFYKHLGKYRLFRWLLGDMLKDLTPKGLEALPDYPNPPQTGIIRCPSLLKKLSFLLPEAWKKAADSTEETSLANGIREITVVNYRLNPFKNDEIVNKCIKFLTRGKFKGR